MGEGRRKEEPCGLSFLQSCNPAILQCHESGTDWPASTQTYSHAKLPPSARIAAAAGPPGTRANSAAIDDRGRGYADRAAPEQPRKGAAADRIDCEPAVARRVGGDQVLV